MSEIKKYKISAFWQPVYILHLELSIYGSISKAAYHSRPCNDWMSPVERLVPFP